MHDDHAAEKRSAGGEKAAIVTEERAEWLGHGEHELAMGELEQYLVCQMSGEQDRPFATAGRAEIETLAGERTKVIVSTLGVRATDTRHAFEIVTTGAKSLPDLLVTLKAIPAVGGGVLLIVPGAEVAEVPFKDGMELVAPTGNVLVPRRGRNGDCRVHMMVYERNELFASDRELVHRSPHNVPHSPDAFSSLRSCEGAGDAVVIWLRRHLQTVVS
jgi:hypothetical protein